MHLHFWASRIEEVKEGREGGALLSEARPPSSALLNPFFGGEGSPTKIDYRKRDTLILTSLLEDLGGAECWQTRDFCGQRRRT